MKVIHVVGARPNFVKIAPIMDAMAYAPERFEQVLVHTGQHYDEQMSQVFFDDLGIPRPDIDLGVGSGSHAEQTARVMLACEPVLLDQRPDLVLVVGDVNSTLACTLVASKLHIPVAHVEGGLRSFDRTMPEEINRVLTDQIADLLFTTERDASQNLLREGVDEEKIHFVGNVMIDTLLRHKERALARDTLAAYDLIGQGSKGAGEQGGRGGEEQGSGGGFTSAPPRPRTPAPYALLTLHRPSNVDVPDALSGILDALAEIQARLPIFFPAHPRTVKRIQEFGFEARLAALPNLRVVEPLGYLDFLNLMANARLVLTDSGGIQEETTILGVPCLTLRENTERPVTVTEGTNRIVGNDPQRIVNVALAALSGEGKAGCVPELWDGRAAERVVSVLLDNGVI